MSSISEKSIVQALQVLGTSRVATLDDQSRRRPVVVTSWQSFARYGGDKPFSAL